MFGTQFVTEVVIGSIGAMFAHAGVDIIVGSAVKDVALTNAQKVCVWTAKTVTETIVAGRAYKTLTGREFLDDAQEIVTGLFGEKDSKETNTTTSDDSKEKEAAVE